MTKKEREKAEAKEELLNYLHPGDTVYTRLNHVSRSGMYRIIEVLIIRENKPLNITWLAAQAMGDKVTKRPKPYGIPVTGCGMDMGFHVIYCLSHALFGKNADCAEKDAGYALKQEWI